MWCCTFGGTSTSLTALNEMDHDTYLQKYTNMKSQRVKVDDSFINIPEDEATEFQNLLEEPKTDHLSVDGVLCFGKENSWKNPEIQDFPHGFENGLKCYYGGPHSSKAQGQDELDLGVLDGFLDEVDEVDDIHAANDISGACEDFLLDAELAEKAPVLDCTPNESSHLQNSITESQSPGFSGSSNGAFGLSETSTETIPEYECKNTMVVKTVICELHDSATVKCECQEPTENYMSPVSRDLENLYALDNDAKTSASGISSDENDKNDVQDARASSLLRQKRLRKPTKRYIEEFSGPKSKDVIERQKRAKLRSNNEHHHVRSLIPTKEPLPETITRMTAENIEQLSKISTASSKEKDFKVRSRNEHYDKALNSVLKKESFTQTNTQTPLESQAPRGRPKKPVPILFSDPESDDDHATSESEDEFGKRRCKKGADRRKHQRMWTLSEVMKLVDGIAKYGTGRWTDIKKLLFSSSAHRTPVDLRDKWRNLLRASCAHTKKHKKEVEQKLKHAMRPLPKSVISRIRELASIHPYPRFMPGGRYIREKKN